jgi:hypothetical protein
MSSASGMWMAPTADNGTTIVNDVLSLAVDAGAAQRRRPSLPVWGSG